MSNRIVRPDGKPADGGSPERGPTMVERLDSCAQDWHHHRTEKAFLGALNAIAYLSDGIANLAKIVDRYEKNNVVIARELHEAKQRIERLEAGDVPIGGGQE